MAEHPILVTVDTGPWLDVLDSKGSVSYVRQMLLWHDQGLIKLFASNRLDLDTWKMWSEQREALRALLAKHEIEKTGSVFRSGVSRLSGSDCLSGPFVERIWEEIRKFREIVSPDVPGSTNLPKRNVGGKLLNKIADYDALSSHYNTRARDVFITLDKKDYFQVARRQIYREKLNLLIQSPEEFVADYADQFNTDT